MPEVHAPTPVRRSGTAVLLFALVLIAGLLIGTRMQVAKRPGIVEQNHVATSLPSLMTSHDSMNIVERQLFRLLAFVEVRVTSRWSGSWGWAIILLTVAFNMLLLPLRIHGMRSGLKMQRIQPQMNAIKARYGEIGLTDPRRTEMTAEVAQLQKDNGVNAFGGCLPLLLQLPLLWAFFGMLRHAEALHGAGWLWLHDLSVADPYHLLPLAMMGSQLLVQWYTPSPGVDANQRKMMALVTTVAFGYVSWHYAAGLALYAVVGSVLSLLFQGLFNRSSGTVQPS